MENISIGASTFRLLIDKEFRNIESMNKKITNQNYINKEIARDTIYKYTLQVLYVYLYRALVLLVASVIIIPGLIFFGINLHLVSLLSFFFVAVSLYYIIKFFKLKLTFKVVVNINMSYIDMLESLDEKDKSTPK